VILAPILAPYGYAEQQVASRLQGPSQEFLLGTDHLGRDLLSRIIFGSRIALAVAVPALGSALVGGICVGLASGYFGGIIDDVVLVILDTIQAFPAIALALLLLALLGPSLANVVVVIGFSWMPAYARVIRAQVLSARNRDYVEAERALGASSWRIVLIHLLPNVVAPVIILAAMDLPAVITFESGLSFLGLGVRPPTPSWGVILSDGFKFIRESPWPILWAGLTLIIITLGCTLFGETLRDVLDPKLSGATEA
jgi:peptide/nickel transport system permease protein